MDFISKNIDKLLMNPNAKNLFVINSIFPQVIPFNRPHKFKIKELGALKTVIFAPLIRNNKNHLGTFHAIGQATIGELAAGMTLLANFGMSKYRFILADLKIHYTYQAKTDLHAVCEVKTDDIVKLEQELHDHDKGTIVLKTTVKDLNDHIVSEVETTWQLKNWKKVQTKS